MLRYRRDYPAPAQPYRQSAYPARVAAAQPRHYHHSYDQARHRPHPYRQGERQPHAEAGLRQHQRPHDPRDARPHRQKCYICSHSQSGAAVYHRHFSSLHLREITGIESSGSSYLCPSCKSHHRPYPEPRTKIIVSDSTLHEFFAPPDHARTKREYKGDIMHVDYVTIPGAKIDTLINAFSLDYIVKPHPRPIDVVLVAGYNDLLAGCSKQDLMNSFLRFTTTVMSAGPSNSVEKNTVVVGDLMYAPQLSWFTDNGPLPSNHRGNMVDQIDWLNQAILSLNLDNGITEYHRLYKYGVRNYTRKHQDMFGNVHHRKIKMHRFEHWREQEPSTMLHLSNAQRYKMGAAINKYFVCRT